MHGVTDKRADGQTTWWYTVWVKKITPWGFLTIFPKWLGIFSPNFTRLLYASIYARLLIFIQLSLILTKLCHIKCDHLAKFYISLEHLLQCGILRWISAADARWRLETVATSLDSYFSKTELQLTRLVTRRNGWRWIAPTLPQRPKWPPNLPDLNPLD